MLWETLVTHRWAILGAKKERRKFQILIKFLLVSDKTERRGKVTNSLHCPKQCFWGGRGAGMIRLKSIKHYDTPLKRTAFTQIDPSRRMIMLANHIYHICSSRGRTEWDPRRVRTKRRGVQQRQWACHLPHIRDLEFLISGTVQRTALFIARGE